MGSCLLAIETSCDETGLAVLQKDGSHITVLSQAVASQINIHTATGGVVPEVAAREHVTVFRPMLEKIMGEANVTPAQLDAIAVTIGPGLQPALAVGVTAARTLAYAWEKPVVPVHHIEGHLYSALVQQTAATEYSVASDKEIFPALALIVSGGHTMLIIMHKHLTYEVIGQTIDDAVGEAFDKVARLLDLPYPGGAALSKLAEQGESTAFPFPRPMKQSGDLNFSFSGLKTAVLYAIRELTKDNKKLTDEQRKNLAASFQHAAVDALLLKVKRALADIQPQLLLLGGGVAANTHLRTQLAEVAQHHAIPLQIAPLALCGDNAVMIGQVGLMALEAGRVTKWETIEPQARIDIEKIL